MKGPKGTGRVIGMLLVLQLAGLIAPFVLLLPLTTGPRNYLATAVGSSLQIKVAVFLLFANGALTIGITIAAFRVFRQYSEALALSQQYARAGGADELVQTLASVVGSIRRWAHLTELLAIDWWIPALQRAVSLRRGAARTGCLWTDNRDAALHRDSNGGSSVLLPWG